MGLKFAPSIQHLHQRIGEEPFLTIITYLSQRILRNTEIPPAKKKCWENMEEKFKRRFEELSELKLNAAKALSTFFSARGNE